MRSTAREHFTVDLRGLRAALASRAATDGVTESDVLRRALVATLGTAATGWPPPPKSEGSGGRRSCAKLSVRLTHPAAHRLDQNSRAAGVSRGAYLTRLIDGAPQVLATSDRIALSNALNNSAEAIAVLSRDVHHLTKLVSMGSVEAARQYTRRFETLDADVRTHLELAGRVLAELARASTPTRRPAPVRVSMRERQP